MGLSNGTVSEDPDHVLMNQIRLTLHHSPVDSLVTFSKTQGTSMASSSGNAPVRYAVRQALDQEYRKETMRKHSDVLNASTKGVKAALVKSATEQQHDAAQRIREGLIKRDFFGRVIEETPKSKDSGDQSHKDESSKAGRKVWVTYHEGFSNAVRKPISMGELLTGL